MSFNVPHPRIPGSAIDVVALQAEDSCKVLDPVLIPGWMKRDTWSREEAVLLLAGYNPNTTQWSKNSTGFGQYAAGNVGYVDGLSDSMIKAANVSWRHPRWEEAFAQFLDLADYARGSPLEERRSPKEWIAWAASKNFTPYWLPWLDGAGKTVPEGHDGLAQTVASGGPGRTESASVDGDPYENSKEWFARQAIAQLENSGTRAIDITAALLLKQLIPLVGNGNCFTKADPQGQWIETADENGDTKRWNRSAIVEWLARRGYGPRGISKAK